MKILGVWKEYLPDGDNPSIHSEEFDLGQVALDVVKYLKQGILLSSLRDGFLVCRLRENYEFTIHDFFTDGEYIWTSGLIDYYEKMGIILPKDFIEHIKSNKYITPRTISKEIEDRADDICNKHIFGNTDDLEIIC